MRARAGPGAVATLATAVVLVSGCTSPSSSTASSGPSGEPSSGPVPATSEPSGDPSPPPTASPTTQVRPPPPRRPGFSAERTMATVRTLAGGIGPRLATGPGFREAAHWVARHLRRLGYEVTRQAFPVPAGDSWGVPVAGGTSSNVVARPPGFDPDAPYLLVGAHLDTVAVAPGAEDNASGVAVLLETARRVAESPGRLPVVFVAFGGEEPRGPGDDEHHLGSRHYVAGMSATERDHLRGMVALDRVGVGNLVPVSSVEGTPVAVRAALAHGAARLGIGTAVGLDAASDHESFADAGLPAARLGSTPYAGYHSAQDVPAVVDPEQLRRTGRVLWELISRAR